MRRLATHLLQVSFNFTRLFLIENLIRQSFAYFFLVFTDFFSFKQRSFYPLYPPSEEINMDLEQLESLAKLEVQPHVLILPSDLLHFFKDINGGLVINPQRLTKGAGGGVFARLAIQAHTDDFTKHVNAEIVRI